MEQAGLFGQGLAWGERAETCAPLIAASPTEAQRQLDRFLRQLPSHSGRIQLLPPLSLAGQGPRAPSKENAMAKHMLRGAAASQPAWPATPDSMVAAAARPTDTPRRPVSTAMDTDEEGPMPDGISPAGLGKRATNETAYAAVTASDRVATHAETGSIWTRPPKRHALQVDREPVTSRKLRCSFNLSTKIVSLPAAGATAPEPLEHTAADGWYSVLQPKAKRQKTFSDEEESSSMIAALSLHSSGESRGTSQSNVDDIGSSGDSRRESTTCWTWLMDELRALRHLHMTANAAYDSRVDARWTAALSALQHLRPTTLPATAATAATTVTTIAAKAHSELAAAAKYRR
ncbi:hypothetical protein THASP1DRAFT_28359 [Thamnocephalis sphaerospora]|uniref:Uncharacterized protein n=1 Tax=Thamnocephalis sphaerospora TaxID=78915 RepID=A0A4P9XUE7_9FUNG|nr:hypothetical protein THASP1DRAFT_28359 [Thamnocephalis sphaerospora]|eukprot:RKP09845.1 hypothetical protein THASP1DRAFT_28359 [Thamnocephalis sphaerospora]